MLCAHPASRLVFFLLTPAALSVGGRDKKEITSDYSVFMALCGPNLTAFRKTSVCFVLFLKLGSFESGFFPSVLELFIVFFKFIP